MARKTRKAPRKFSLRRKANQVARSIHKTLVKTEKRVAKQFKKFMKTSIKLIRAAGLICLLIMIFHALFHKMFNWPESLNCLDNRNRSIFLTYHFIIILITGFMAFVALFQTKSLLQSNLRYSILGMFSLFFLIRIITEFTLFGIRSSSPVILILCLVPMAFFLLPMIVHTEND